MRVPSKSKNAPVAGPSGLRATSSTSVSTKPLNVTESPDPVQVRTGDNWTGSVDERDRALGAVGHRELRLVEQLGRHVLEQPDAVALVVGFEHRGGEDVATAVTGAGFGVDAELHGRQLTPTARLTNC